MDRRSPDGPPPHGGGEDELTRLRRELAERDRRIVEQQAALEALVRSRAVPEWGAAAGRPPGGVDTAPHGHGQQAPTAYGPAGPNVGLGMVANFIAGVMSPSRAASAHAGGGGGDSSGSAGLELSGTTHTHTTPPPSAQLATPFLQQQHPHLHDGSGGVPSTTTTRGGSSGGVTGVRARTGRGSRNHGDDPSNAGAGGSGSLRSGGGSADSGGYGGSAAGGGSGSPYSAKSGGSSGGVGAGKQAFGGPVLMAPAPTMATATSTSTVTTSASVSDEQLARFLQQQEEARLQAGVGGGVTGGGGGGYGSFGPGAVAPLVGGGVYAHLPSGGSSTGGGATGADRDAALAAAMQQEEMMFASAMQAAEQRREREAAPIIEDPVWGSYTGRPGEWSGGGWERGNVDASAAAAAGRGRRSATQMALKLTPPLFLPYTPLRREALQAAGGAVLLHVPVLHAAAVRAGAQGGVRPRRTHGVLLVFGHPDRAVGRVAALARLCAQRHQPHDRAVAGHAGPAAGQERGAYQVLVRVCSRGARGV
jgi:hypothetical protein